MVPDRPTPRSVGKFVYQKVSKLKFRPDASNEDEKHLVTGSWDDPQIELIKAVDENQRALPRNDR